ncbi:hypothetical protein BaRGS_00014852 [Batillaria attramentaria]|uniref:Uncharacterized protein n=1 Tax=Batillaria attramentaria TaxID=370345 RepID=A0ABD0L3B5_9CAEN
MPRFYDTGDHQNTMWVNPLFTSDTSDTLHTGERAGLEMRFVVPHYLSASATRGKCCPKTLQDQTWEARKANCVSLPLSHWAF